MALIEELHVLPDMYDVNPSTNPSVVAGQVITLDSSGYAVKATNTSGFVVGIAGDSTIEETEDGEKNSPEQEALVLNSKGASRNTSNRVSDAFDESLASAKLTVYNANGRFWTDQYETDSGGPVTYAIGESLYSSANGKLLNDSNSSSAPFVGVVVGTPQAYPSGVPGTDVEGSISWGTYLNFLLRV